MSFKCKILIYEVMCTNSSDECYPVSCGTRMAVTSPLPHTVNWKMKWNRDRSATILCWWCHLEPVGAVCGRYGRLELAVVPTSTQEVMQTPSDTACAASPQTVPRSYLWTKPARAGSLTFRSPARGPWLFTTALRAAFLDCRISFQRVSSDPLVAIKHCLQEAKPL